MKRSKSPPAAKAKAPTAEEIVARDTSAIGRIAAMDDPDKLRNLMANADRMGAASVSEAALRRLADVQIDADAHARGSVGHDFMTTINAYETVLRQDRGKAVRLTPTRQKVTRVGAVKALAGFAEATKDMRGFELLLERGLPDMTGEAVILRHPGDFDEATRDAAATRLTGAGVDPATLAA